MRFFANLLEVVADYTLGTAIVLTHVVIASRMHSH